MDCLLAAKPREDRVTAAAAAPAQVVPAWATAPRPRFSPGRPAPVQVTIDGQTRGVALNRRREAAPYWVGGGRHDPDLHARVLAAFHAACAEAGFDAALLAYERFRDAGSALADLAALPRDGRWCACRRHHGSLFVEVSAQGGCADWVDPVDWARPFAVYREQFRYAPGTSEREAAGRLAEAAFGGTPDELHEVIAALHTAPWRPEGPR